MNVKAWGLLAAGGAVVCACALAGFLGGFWWVFDLFSHFRVQYAAGLALLALIFLAGRRRGTALMFLSFAALNAAVVLPLWFGGSRADEGATPRLRVMLLNVNSRLGDPERVREVVLKEDPDILVLEEVSYRWAAVMGLLTKSYPQSLIIPREDNFGIALFSKLPLEDRRGVEIGSAGVPSIHAKVRTAGALLHVIATHPLPPGGRDYSLLRNEQLARLPDHVPRGDPVLLLGDLNVTPWSVHFRRLLHRSGLRDSAKGFGVQPTWPNFNPLLRIPLDHCLHSPDIRIVDRRVGEDVASDHYPLIVDIVVPPK